MKTQHERFLKPQIKRSFCGLALLFLGSSFAQQDSSPVGNYRKEGIDVVQQRQFQKRGRHEFSLDLGVNPDNQFLFYEFISGRYTYHLREGIALETSYSRAFSQERRIIDDLKNVPCPPGLTVTDSSGNPVSTCGITFQNPLDPFENVFFANVVWSPLYGKFAIFSKKIFHFDVYFLAGGGLFDTQNTERFGVNIGAGTKIFLNDFTSLRIDVRNFTVREGAPFNQLANNRVYSVGLSFFLPTQTKKS